VDGNRTAQDIGDELYALSPGAFTAARDGYVSDAKNAGNRALATELAALKRPTVSAGLVNLVALRRPESVSLVLELGETIRAAQGNVSPVQLRDLSAQRRKELDTVVALAATLAQERGDAEPSRAALTEVEATFAAAMADDSAARLVKSGRVMKALSYSGFGQSTDDTGGFAAAAGALAGAPPKHPGPQQEVPRGPKRDAQADRRAAEQAAERAEAERAELRAEAERRETEARQHLADATTAEADAESWGQRLADQIAELKQQLEVAQRDARTARQARIAAERDLASAQRRVNRLS
jgi:hypothetical protein